MISFTSPVDTIALVGSDGRRMPLDVARWRAETSSGERALLSQLDDPVLDIGCGPGRVAVALAAAGRPCLGIDPAPAAAREARARGANVLTRSIFDALPGEGRWSSAVLFDGNVGIGGDPVALLARVHAVLRPGGGVLAELEPPGAGSERLVARLEVGGVAAGAWFPWARLAADDFASVAVAAHWLPSPPVEVDGRWFALATRA